MYRSKNSTTWMITWIQIGGADCDDWGGYGDVLEYFIAVGHRIEKWRVVVQVQDVAVHGYGTRQARMSSILRLHHQNVVLYLQIKEQGVILLSFVRKRSGVNQEWSFGLTCVQQSTNSFIISRSEQWAEVAESACRILWARYLGDLMEIINGRTAKWRKSSNVKMETLGYFSCNR